MIISMNAGVQRHLRGSGCCTSANFRRSQPITASRSMRSKNKRRFEVMRTVRVMIVVAGAALVALGARATAELALPDGPNRELVSRMCGACHDLGTLIGAGGRSREGWDGTIDAMASFGL